MNNPQVSSSAGPKRKGFISEGDVALLLRRYSASTILALLQEVANSAETKLNWSYLVKNTNTGIKNAKEYQALWRHLAYRTNIAESFEDDAEPLDDDSDLEFEVEPLPGVSPEVAADVAACVKVLATTGAPGNTPMQNSETCFTIDIPNSSSGWEVKGNGQISNVVVPGAPSSEAQPVRKKRKRWTLEEDQELVAAVEQCGEGNWAVILKGAFKHDRTAAQLSQRWALIRKRRENQSGSSHNMVVDGQAQATGNATGGTAPVPLLTPAEGQKTSIPALGTTASGAAAAMNISLPTTGSNIVPLEQSNSPVPNISNTSALPPLAGKARPSAKKIGNTALQGRPAGMLTSSVAAQAASAIGGQPKATPGSTVPVGPVVNQVPGRYNVSSGLRNSPVNFGARGNPKVSTGPDPMVQAAAVAAGARIAPASAAASLLKAAQSGNIVHIGPSGVSMAKPGMQSQMGSSTVSSGLKVGAGAGTRNPSGHLVHYIRTGSGSTQSVVLNGQRATQMKSQPNRTGSAPEAITPQPAAVVGLSGQAACGPPGPSLPVQKPLPSSPTMLLATRLKVKGSHIPGDSSANAVLNSPVKPTDSGEGSVAINHTTESNRHIVGPSSQCQLPVSSLENNKPAAVAETVVPFAAVEKTTTSPLAMSCPMQSEEGKSVPEVTKRRLLEELKPVEATSSHGCLSEKENLSSTSKDLQNLSAAKAENA